jgi:hypothetical protein
VSEITEIEECPTTLNPFGLVPRGLHDRMLREAVRELRDTVRRNTITEVLQLVNVLASYHCACGPNKPLCGAHKMEESIRSEITMWELT